MPAQPGSKVAGIECQVSRVSGDAASPAGTSYTSPRFDFLFHFSTADYC